MLQGMEARRELQGGEGGQRGGGSPSWQAQRRRQQQQQRHVQFLLPHTVMEVPRPQEEEGAFYQRLEDLLRPDQPGGHGFEELFAADGWEDLIEDKRLRKRLVQWGHGEGSRPHLGQEVTVKLLGALEDLSLVEKDPRRTFVAGQGEAIQALDLGVLSMELGEASLFLAQPACAYGHLGREPDIPKDAVLLYEVTLLQVQDSPDPGLLPAVERLQRGNQKRELGNFHFERGEYRWALRAYQQALQVLPLLEKDGLRPEEAEEGKALRIKCLNNCAAAQLKLRLLDEALASCNEVMLWDPDNTKALFRKGKLLSERGEDEAAMVVLKKALQLEPATKAIHVELSKLSRRQRRQRGCPGLGGTLPEASAAPSAADGHQSGGSAPQPS